jgi:hypothetical protein
MHSDELLFLCELIHVQPDREKSNVLFEEVLNLLVERQHHPAKVNGYMQTPTSHAPGRPAV